MPQRLLKSGYTRTLTALIQNILLSFVLFFIARALYFAINFSLFSHIEPREMASMLKGGVMYDLAGMAYINILYVVIMLLPLHLKEHGAYQRFAKCVFITLNSVALAANMADAVYYPFTKRRTTGSLLNEFGNDAGVSKIIFDELLNRWYLVVIAVLIIYALCRLYRSPRGEAAWGRLIFYYPLQLLYLVLGIGLSVAAMRGGIGADVRPITLGNAALYVDNADHTALVLNTPFSFIRTLGKEDFVDPKYYAAEELKEIFTPVKSTTEPHEAKAQNVVILIVESFGKEYFGSLTQPGRQTYTPFLDSLVQHSLTYNYSFSNGIKSIDAMPSVLSGIPMFSTPFFVTSSSVNEVSGVAEKLAEKGLHTSFFHGAARGSMGFQAFAHTTGYEEYYGREDYGNDADFDGRWAIWDEEFLQYFASTLSTFTPPFATTLFTASSHHPFKVPKRYVGKFPEGTIPIHKCVGYTDNALRRFFETASQQEWFDSTLFVITADHTSLTAYPAEANSLTRFEVPIIFYQKGSELVGRSNTIAQQIDIMPTVLNYMGYSGSHVSFGKDLFSCSEQDSYAVNYNNGVYQYFEGDLMLQFDGEKSVGLYNFKQDRALKSNILATNAETATKMERKVKAIIQQYMWRMESDKLTLEEE